MHPYIPDPPDTPTPPEPDDPSSQYDGPSKSQRKRDATALQKMGEELVGLSKERLAKIDLSDNLRIAIRDAQRISAHGALKRQMQYIGKLMRDVDPTPIQAALDEVHGVSAAATARQHALERLRTRLIEDDAVIGEIARDFPGADLQHLRQLRRNTLREKEQNKPPRAFRELFRVLRELGNGEQENPAMDDADDGAAAE